MAANDFITIKRDQVAAIEAAELLQYKTLLRQAYELGIRIRAKMRHNFDDSGGANTTNWAPLETLWGIPPGSTSVGTAAVGSRVFTFIDGSVGSLEGAFQTSAGKDLTEVIG